MSKKLQKAKIKDWRIINNPRSWRVSFVCLAGTIVDHPKFLPGAKVVTSSLLRIDCLKMTARSRNTIYELIGGMNMEDHSLEKEV